MNELQKKDSKFSVAIQGAGFKRLINNTLGDPKRAAGFVTAITSAVSANPDLQDCDAGSILSAGLLGETLQLSPSPQLGQYYLVPYNDKKKGKVAQFQVGWKGYVQLAERSGEYKRINAIEIKEGELKAWNPLTEELEVEIITDEAARCVKPTIGYCAFLEYHNGFTKTIYWSKEKMEDHALKYSKAYANDVKKGTQFTFWSKNFDAMAIKTMLRQLISKWGIMSIDMQKAVKSDMAAIREDFEPDYVDNPTHEETETVEVETVEAEVVEAEEVDLAEL